MIIVQLGFSTIVAMPIIQLGYSTNSYANSTARLVLIPMLIVQFVYSTISLY